MARKKTACKRNTLPNRTMHHPYGYQCMFCHEGGVSKMESVVTKRHTTLYFHKKCFEKYCKEMNKGRRRQGRPN